MVWKYLEKLGKIKQISGNSTGMEISEDMFICIYLLFSAKFWKMPFDSPQEMFRKNCNVWLSRKGSLFPAECSHVFNSKQEVCLLE